jgi:hypothetical protein
MEAMEKNINYLKFILKQHEEDYRDYLKRNENLGVKTPQAVVQLKFRQ